MNNAYNAEELIFNGERLFYLTQGKGDLTFLFIHNTGGDHQIFMPQLDFFSRFGRVVVPDLQGHGKSDKNKKEYSIESYGNGLVNLCKKLSLNNVIAIGCSTGGNVSLDLACRYPDLVKAVVMIDCGMFLSAQVHKKIQEYKQNVQQQEISAFSENLLNDSCLPTDKCRDLMREAYKVVPTYVWESAFSSLIKWDKGNKLRLPNCKAPILYIEACAPMSDRSHLANFKEFFKYYPALMTGKIVGSGHYPSLEVPEQVNAMIMDFLRLKGFHLNK